MYTEDFYRVEQLHSPRFSGKETRLHSLGFFTSKVCYYSPLERNETESWQVLYSQLLSGFLHPSFSPLPLSFPHSSSSPSQSKVKRLCIQHDLTFFLFFFLFNFKQEGTLSPISFDMICTKRHAKEDASPAHVFPTLCKGLMQLRSLLCSMWYQLLISLLHCAYQAHLHNDLSLELTLPP